LQVANCLVVATSQPDDPVWQEALAERTGLKLYPVTWLCWDYVQDSYHGQALLTGRLAAEAVLCAPDGAEAKYIARARAALVADHRMALLLGRALSHRKGARFAVALAGATPWTRRNFARWLFEDYPRALIATPRRWRRGMFTPPGAFDQGAVSSDP